MTRAEARLQGGKDRVGGPELDSSFKTVKIERMLAVGGGVAELRMDFFLKESVCSSIFVSKEKRPGRSEEIGSSRDWGGTS